MNIPEDLPALIISMRLEQGEIAFTEVFLGSLDIFDATGLELQQAPQLFLNRIKNINLLAKISDALVNQTSFEVELQFESAHGTEYWLHCALTANDAQCGSACIIDVSETHRQAEHTKKSAEFFTQLQNQLEDLFYFKDRRSRILGGNKAFCEYHGVTDIEELLGKTDFDSKRIPERDKEDIFKAEQEIMMKGSVLRKREQSWDKYGAEYFLESIKTPLKNETKEIIGLVGITRDITAQVRSEQTLEQAKITAEEVSKAKSAFLAVMSHEIRTPMNGVIGCTSLLSKTNLDTTQQQFVDTIKSSGDSLLRIINDILDYSKIEAGKFELCNCEFELRDVVEHCLNLFGRDAADKYIEMNALVDAKVPETFWGDPARLRQILSNLVGNAVKFTNHGEIFIDIQVASIDLISSTCELKIQIKDTGIGIEKDKQKKLFEAFTQADSSITRKFGGTGLGLVICKKLVDLMGGEITCNSQIHQGTTFEIQLNLPYTKTKPKPEYQRILTALKNKMALIVDDNNTNRMVLEKLCEQHGINSRSANNTDSALNLLESSENFDLILLDFCMPDVHGGEFAQKLRSIERFKSLPIILLSSIYTPNEYKNYVNGFLLKPFSSKRLLESMHQSLRSTNNLSSPEKFTKLAPKETQILVIEDNQVNQMVLCSMLNKLHYMNITSVEHGAAGVEMAKNQTFDLIFMDIQMPVMGGIEATKHIRQLPRGDLPWIIALTAEALKEDETLAYQAGMNSYITKPITLESLQNALILAEDIMQASRL